MPQLEPRGPGFTNVKQLINRMNLPDGDGSRISADDGDVPAWQRQIVWNDDEMGLLALSIIRNFPIGMIVLWRQERGLRVPIDGRQRLSAIKYFFDGRVAIPDLPMVPAGYRKRKYRLQPNDAEDGFQQVVSRKL